MSVVLLFPPVVDPRAPHLSIPSLVAYLRQNGVQVSVRDLNVEALDWISGESHLTSAAVALETRLATERLDDNERRDLLDLLTHVPFVVSHAAGAAEDLRSANTFF